MELKIGQIWESPTEQFKLTGFGENKVILFGLTKVSYLGLNEGGFANIDRSLFESFLNDEMDEFKLRDGNF